MAGIEDLNKAIERFEKAQADLREEIRIAHVATKGMREERKALEAAKKDILESFDEKIKTYVETELAELGEMAREASNHLYTKVGEQIDILINTALGKHMSRSGRKEDLRPALAAKLRVWLQEELDKKT